MELDADLERLISIALAEDLSRGDITSEALIPPALLGRAQVVIKARGIIAGGNVAKYVFNAVDPGLAVEVLLADGTRVRSGDVALAVSGRVRGILAAERTALNFMQRLSGIATLTGRFVSRTKGCNCHITETRKTTPGLRTLEKYAVRVGGGHNHRFDLGGALLIKDNHIAALRATGLKLGAIVARAKENCPPGMVIEVEVGTAQEALEAVRGGADVIMFDNMTPDEIRQAMTRIPPHARTEASGGITLANIRAVAETGVDTISIGALTHSPKALDMSLELQAQTMLLA